MKLAKIIRLFCIFFLATGTVRAGSGDMTTLSVAAGYTQFLALRSDGTVWSWGVDNEGPEGLLGITNLFYSDFPVRIPGLSNIVHISANAINCMALQSNGTIWAWGDNRSGQLGNGSTNTKSFIPVQVTNITSAVWIASGGSHSLAVLSNGQVMAWGDNTYGQLGNGTNLNTNRPVLVSGLTNAIRVDASSYSSAALTASGRVWCWGNGGAGEMGIGSTSNFSTPVQSSNLTSIVDIAAHDYGQNLALKSDGTVWSWGGNEYGDLGLGTYTNTFLPTQISNLSNVQAIGAGFGYGIAAFTNGQQAVVWGSVDTQQSAVPIPLSVAPPFRQVAYGEDTGLGVTATGAVWAWGNNTYFYNSGGFGNGDTSDLGNWALIPTLSFNPTPVARSGMFTGGDDDFLGYQSLVVPIDLETGVNLNPTGSDAYCFTNSVPWFLSIQKQTLYQLASANANGSQPTAFPVENPLVAFGSTANGSPLYLNHPYRFSAYAGGFDENAPGSTNVIQISVYNPASFTAGATNIAPINTFNIPLPRRTVSADSNAWTSFVLNGSSTTFTSNGLTTTVEFLDDDHATNAFFGRNWLTNANGTAAVITNFIYSSYKITHMASATNYCYKISVLGKAQVTTNTLAYFATNSSGTWSALPLYTLNFDQQPALRSTYLDRLLVAGTPMPPAYENTNFSAPNGLSVAVTNTTNLTASVYTNLDASPELRRHPILDQFVLDMNKDPLALASYVINEIELTDPYADAQSNQVIKTTINCGGVDRSALGTFLEGQGSPIEQCALLVYLLRQAGYPAAYVFPTNGNLMMSASHISQLWKANVQGIVSDQGVPYLTNSLLTVDYPWVVANINGNTVHIFPWIKDTEIVQGVNLYDYMPTNYNTALQWVEQYVRGNPSILGLDPENNPSKLFPEFVEQALLTNALGQSISMDDLGVTTFNRPHQFPTWAYLPQPDLVTNLTSLVVVDSLSASTNTYPILAHIFDIVDVQLYNTTGSATNLLLDTGVWDACDFNDRKMLVYNDTTNIYLWLAPYNSNVTNTLSFTNAAPSSTALQVISTNLGTITNVHVQATYYRQVAYLTQPVTVLPAIQFAGAIYDSYWARGNVSGIAMDFGRVTQAMLLPYENTYWGLQQQRAINTNFVPAVQDFQGTAAYLLAMNYFKRVDAFNALNLQWHMLSTLMRKNIGAGKILPGNSSTNMQLGLDMILGDAFLLTNPTERNNQFNDAFNTLQNYFYLMIVQSSAEEHDTMEQMFPSQDAISAVRLLQLAQNATNSGRSPIVELINNSYVSQGNTNYMGYGTTLLKNEDAAMWSDTTNVFALPDGDYARALMTPGVVTNHTGTYSGMGSLILSDNGYWEALISSELAPAHGGFSEDVQNMAPQGPGDTLPYNLADDQDSGPSFAPNSPSQNVTTAFTPLDDAGLQATSGSRAFTETETTEASQVDTQFGQSGATAPGTALEAAGDNGYNGQPVGWVQTAGQPVNDPVDPISGEFYVDAIDLTLPGPFPLQMRRNYLSQNLSANEFGYGWKLNFVPYLVVTTNAASQSVIYGAEMDGALIAYHQTNSGGPWVVLPPDNPSLNNHSVYGTGSTGNFFNSKLNCYTTNGTTYIISAPDGSTRTYQMMTFAITNNGSQMNRTRPYLTRWQDHSGNFALFSYGTNSSGDDYGQLNQINMANGNSLVFKYDFYARIYQAFTQDGRFMQYQYDGYGDLITVILPDNSQCQYQYQHYNFVTNGTTNLVSSHLMLQEIKPDGRIVANAYDTSNRVVTQASTVGTNLVLITNGYFFYTNSATNGFISGSTGVQDVFQNPTVYYYTSNLMTGMVDPLGQATTNVWYPDTPNGLTGYYPRSLRYTVDKRGLAATNFYDASGNVTQTVLLGNLTGEGLANQLATNTCTYTANNLPATVTDPVGNGMQFVYDTTDPFKVIQAIRTSGGTPVSTNLLCYTNVGTSAFGLVSIITNGGAVTAFTYNSNGFKVTQVQYPVTPDNPSDTDPVVTHNFSYNLRGQLYQDQIAGGGLTQFDFDAMGRMISRLVFDQNNSNLSSEYFYYNANGELEWYDGPRSNPEDYKNFVYDGAGRVIQQINWRSQGMINGGGVEAPDGYAQYAVTFQTFDGFGNNTSVTDQRGVVTTNAFDVLGRMTKQQVIETNGTVLRTETFGYEPGNQVAFTTNALGGYTHTLYTQTGQPCYRQDADGATNGRTYYLDGRPKRDYLPNGSYWQTTYDDVHLLLTRTFYNAGGTSLASKVSGFDRRGNQILKTDEASNSFTNTFDGLNRVKSAAGPIISYSTPAGAPGSAPGSVQQTIITYYDAAGLAMTNVNALGEKTISRFDVLGRVTDAEIHDSGDNLVRIATTAYSADHQSKTVTQGSGTSAIVSTVYTDNQNNPVLSILSPSPGVQEFILRQYDMVENLVSETHNTTANGAVTQWTAATAAYDGLHRPVSRIDRDGASSSFAFDAANNLTNRTMPGGLVWRATFNSNLQMQCDYDIGSGGAVTRSNSYTYSSLTGLLQTSTDGRGVTCTHYYDAFLRPASNSYSGPLPEHAMVTSWSYDPRGLTTNISESFASTNTGPNTSVATAFDAYGQLQIDNVSAGSFSYQTAFSRDSAGRRSQLGFGSFGFSYAWRADGLLASVNGLMGGGSYVYDTGGQLSTRSVSPMVSSITQRDGTGRPLAASTTINGSTIFTENLSYTGDGLPATDTMTRPDFTDGRSYTYAPQSRRLTQEILNLSTNVTWTNTFTFDRGSNGGPGVLTGVGEAPGATAATWNGGTDAFSRVSAETNSVAQRQANGYANGTATITALINGNPMPVTMIGTNWDAELELAPGSNQLIVNAVNWSGHYTASATNAFTNNAADHVVNTFSGDGELTNRVWYNSSGQSNRTQSLSWDAKGRLHSVTDLDTNGYGYSWSAIYDALDRRLQTAKSIITNGITATNPPTTISQYYDPEVESLELAVTVNGVTTWKIYGPDANGVYGGMQGVGGLDATGTFDQYPSPIISDVHGNGYAAYQQLSLNWYSSRVTAYGAVPGYRPVPLTDGADLAHSSAWNGKWADPMQTCQLGCRPYGLVGSYWLSADPMSHNADPSLYAFCAALNPVAAFDPTGMCAESQNPSSSGPITSEDLAYSMPGTDPSTLDSMARRMNELGLSGGMALMCPGWALAAASGTLNQSMYSSSGMGYSAPASSDFSVGQFAADSLVNASEIQSDWSYVSHPDFSSGWGMAIWGSATVGLAANVVGAVGNVLSLGELGVARNAVKTGLVDLTRVEVETASTRALTEAEQTLYGRVTHPRGFREEVWEMSKSPDGNVYDPNGRILNYDEPWELGHTPDNKFSDAQVRAAQEGWDRQTWISTKTILPPTDPSCHHLTQVTSGSKSMNKQNDFRKGGMVSVWIGDFKSDIDLDDYMNLSRQFERDFDFELNERDMPETIVKDEPTSIAELVNGFSWSESYAAAVTDLATKQGVGKLTTMIIFLNLDYRPQGAILKEGVPLRFLGSVRFS